MTAAEVTSTDGDEASSSRRSSVESGKVTSVADSGWGSLEARTVNEQQDKTAESTSTGRDEAKSSVESDTGTSTADNGWENLGAIDVKGRQAIAKSVESASADRNEGVITGQSDKSTSAADSDHGNLSATDVKEQQAVAKSDENAGAVRDGGGITRESDQGTAADSEAMALTEEQYQAAAAAECTSTERYKENQTVETDKGKCCKTGYTKTCQHGSNDKQNHQEQRPPNVSFR